MERSGQFYTPAALSQWQDYPLNWGGSQSQPGSFGEEKYHCPYHTLNPDPSTFFMAILSSFSTSVLYSRPQLLPVHTLFNIPYWG